MRKSFHHPELSLDIPRIISCKEPAYAISRDCDCACSVAAFSDQHISYSRIHPVVTDLRTSSDLKIIQVSEEYCIAYIPSGYATENRIAVLNNSAMEILNAFQPKQAYSIFHAVGPQERSNELINPAIIDFLRLGLLVDTREKLLNQDLIFSQLNEQQTLLSAWLHITDRCNLRCDYCYLPHFAADMSLEIGYKAIDAIFRSANIHGYKQVKIKYAGGEPLLCFPIIKELHRYAQKLKDQSGIGLDGIVLSNGTLLTQEILESMGLSGLRLMISLDDVSNTPKNSRHYPDGRCSSNEAMQAIELALANGLIPDISITISGRNIEHLAEVVDWVLERDLPFGINFYRENAFSGSISDLQLKDDKIIEGLFAAYKTIETNLPRRSLLASLLDRTNLSFPHLRTCSAGQDYLVIDYQGRVAKCQMQMNTPITTIYSTDLLQKLRTDQTGLPSLTVEQKKECCSCEWKYWCAGGCPLETYRLTGRYDTYSPHCNIYKALFPEIIRLEGLRLLRYHANPV